MRRETGTGKGRLKIRDLFADGRRLEAAEVAVGVEAEGRLRFFPTPSLMGSAEEAQGGDIFNLFSVFSFVVSLVRSTILGQATAERRGEPQRVVGTVDWNRKSVYCHDLPSWVARTAATTER